MVQFVGEMNSDIVFEEVQRHTNTIMHSDQVRCQDDVRMNQMQQQQS